MQRRALGERELEVLEWEQRRTWLYRTAQRVVVSRDAEELY